MHTGFWRKRRSPPAKLGLTPGLRLVPAQRSKKPVLRRSEMSLTAAGLDYMQIANSLSVRSKR